MRSGTVFMGNPSFHIKYSVIGSIHFPFPILSPHRALCKGGNRMERDVSMWEKEGKRKAARRRLRRNKQMDQEAVCFLRFRPRRGFGVPFSSCSDSAVGSGGCIQAGRYSGGVFVRSVRTRPSRETSKNHASFNNTRRGGMVWPSS